MNAIPQRSALPRDWWPLCAHCGREVDLLEAMPMPDVADRVDRAIRRYRVTCHGEAEIHLVGIWAAFELASKRGRLPSAFTDKTLTA